MSAALPIRKVVLYKHGVGFFERRGKVSGEQAVGDRSRMPGDEEVRYHAVAPPPCRAFSRREAI